MADRKKERERLRAERLAAERAAGGDERRRLILGYFVAGLLAVLVVAGIVVAVMNSGGGSGGEVEANEAAGIDPNTGAGNLLTDLEPDEREGTPPPEVKQADLELAAKAANCDLRLNLEDEGNTHLEDDTEVPDYKTNPPNSGNHSAENLPDGAYLGMPGLVNIVHSLEHGRVEFQYNPKLSEDEQLSLKGVFDQDPQAILFFPNAKMPYAVAATAWTNMLVCDEYSPEVVDALIAFRDTYRGQGPEAIPF